MKRTFILAAALVAIGIVFLTPAYIRPDSVGTYEYLRSAVFDHDLLFLNEWSAFGMISHGFPLFKEVTPFGTLANHWWVGAAIASAPFYVVARVIDRSPDGFLGAYGWTLAWCAVLFTLVTLFCAMRVMPEERRRRGIAVIAVLFGTPLFWYTFRFPLGTHAAGAMFIALAVVAGLHERRFTTGLLLGLAIATRLQHFVLLPAFVVLAIRRRIPARGYVHAAAGLLLGVLPQAIAWGVIYGNPIGPLMSGANLSGTTWMPFRTLAFGAVLLSSYHGLFIWSPVVLLAVIGWIEGLRDHRDAALLFLLMFGGEWIANATFDRYFWGGMSFGPRRWVDLAAPFAVGIAWFARSRLREAAIALTTLWSCALTLGALCGTLELARYVGDRDLLPRLAPIQLHSFVSNPSWSSVVALLIVAVLGAALAFARRYLVPAATVYLMLVSVALAAMAPATLGHAQAQLQRFKINPSLSRLGPLLDERRLLGDELDYLRATGRETRARATQKEIDQINTVIRNMTR